MANLATMVFIRRRILIFHKAKQKTLVLNYLRFLVSINFSLFIINY